MQDRLLYKAIVIGGALLLSACNSALMERRAGTQAPAPASAPVQQTSTPAAAPEAPEEPEETRYLANVLLGASMKALQSSLGEPDIIFGEQNARFLRYDGPGCAVHILIEKDTVIEVTPRKRNGKPLAKKIADECFHQMVKTRRADADDG